MRFSKPSIFLAIWTASLFGHPCPAKTLDPLTEAEDRREIDSPVLVKATSSSRPSLRIRAARAYGRIQKPGAVTPLLSLLRDPSLRVRVESIFALGQLGWDSHFQVDVNPRFPRFSLPS